MVCIVFEIKILYLHQTKCFVDVLMFVMFSKKKEIRKTWKDYIEHIVLSKLRNFFLGVFIRDIDKPFYKTVFEVIADQSK